MSLHEGHRLRAYQKIQKDALADHEWLEILLYNAVPRKNTNELAHALIFKFGSVDKVFEATMEELQQVSGVGVNIAAYLCCVGHFMRNRKAKEELTYYGKFDSRSFLPFVKKAYENVLVEVVDLYLLDGEGRVLKKQRFSIDSISTVRVIPEELSSFLLTKNASGAVMVHNHPFGEATPSEADDSMTKNCQVLCSMHNRLLCEHIIYAPNGMYSYYLSGRMREISEKYSVINFLE